MQAFYKCYSLPLGLTFSYKVSNNRPGVILQQQTQQSDAHKWISLLLLTASKYHARFSLALIMVIHNGEPIWIMHSKLASGCRDALFSAFVI